MSSVGHNRNRAKWDPENRADLCVSDSDTATDQLCIRRRTLLSRPSHAHHGATMAQVAPTDPAIAETVIGDNEEDKSKVRGVRPSIHVTTVLLSYHNLPQEILLMKQRVEEMEREAKKLRELQAAAESSTGVEHPEGEEGVPMETEDEKALIDNRSVFVGNVCNTFSYFGHRLTVPARYRSIIVQQLKISRPTSKLAVPSTVSQSSVTNLQVTPKGKQLFSLLRFLHDRLNSLHIDLPTSSLQSQNSLILLWHWIIPYFMGG